jgi:hypothetical protein
MNALAIARAIHVLAVVVWIGSPSRPGSHSGEIDSDITVRALLFDD